MMSSMRHVSLTAAVLATALFLAVPTISAFARDSTELAPYTGNITRNIGTIDGRERTFVTYSPRDLKPNSPLLIMFHGGGGDGPTARIGTGGEFDALADRDGFVVVYPDGIARSWNTCRTAQQNVARRWQIDDSRFVEAIIAHEVAGHGIDPHRVFVTGHSNGAALTYRLALERPDLVAGIAAVSSNLPTADNMACKAQNVPTPVMVINGTADPVSYYNGGRRPGSPNGPALSTKATMEYFAKMNGQTGEPEVTRLPHMRNNDPTAVERTAWTAPDKPPVILYTVLGGGHVVPNRYYRYPQVVGRMTDDLDAPAVIWDFFSKLPPRQ